MALTHHDLLAGLQTLKDEGLGFHDCIQAFGETGSPYIKAALGRYLSVGRIEFDDCAVVFKGCDGAHVMAWVWVSERDLTEGQIERYVECQTAAINRGYMAGGMTEAEYRAALEELRRE